MYFARSQYNGLDKHLHYNRPLLSCFRFEAIFWTSVSHKVRDDGEFPARTESKRILGESTL